MPFNIDHLIQHDLILDSPQISTFDDDTLYPFIVTGVMARLQTLLLNEPLTLKDGSQDNFEKLRESCRECQVDLGNILDAEIERRIRHGFLMENDDEMKPIYAHEDALKLTPSHLLELHFGQRLFGIYQKYDFEINKKKDSIHEIETALNYEAERHNLPVEQLYYAMLRRLLKLIKHDIKKDNLHIEKSGVPVIYKKIVEEISRAENEEREEEEKETQHGTRWIRTFNNIISLAKTEKSALDKEIQFNREAPKRQCSSAFFNPYFARQSVAGVYEFLDLIEAVSSIRDFEKTFLKELQKTP